MPTVIGVGTDQSKWAYLAPTAATAALLPAGEYAYKSVLSATSPTTGYYLLTLGESNTLALMFYGKGDPGAIATARVWGVSNVPTSGVDNFMGMYLGTISVVLGGTQASTGLFSGDTYNFADQTNATEDRTNTPPGIRVVGDGPDGSAMLILDSIGFSKIIVQLTNIVDGQGGPGADPTAEVGFLWRAF